MNAYQQYLQSTDKNTTLAEYAQSWLVDQQNVLDSLTSQCQALRASEYPPITDYIDGVVKGDQAQIDAYIAACQAVKAKYPKPE